MGHHGLRSRPEFSYWENILHSFHKILNIQMLSWADFHISSIFSLTFHIFSIFFQIYFSFFSPDILPGNLSFQAMWSSDPLRLPWHSMQDRVDSLRAHLGGLDFQYSDPYRTGWTGGSPGCGDFEGLRNAWKIFPEDWDNLYIYIYKYYYIDIYILLCVYIYILCIYILCIYIYCVYIYIMYIYIYCIYI